MNIKQNFSNDTIIKDITHIWLPDEKGTPRRWIKFEWERNGEHGTSRLKSQSDRNVKFKWGEAKNGVK